MAVRSGTVLSGSITDYVVMSEGGAELQGKNPAVPQGTRNLACSRDS